MSDQAGIESCYFCDNEDVEVHEEHHIIPRRYGGSDQDENIVQLCPTCHRKIERLYGYRFYNKLGVGDGVPKGERFVRELSEVNPSYDECKSPIDGGLEYKYELLKHFGLDPREYLCPGCFRICVPQDYNDGEDAICPRCGVSFRDVEYKGDILHTSFIEPRNGAVTRGGVDG